MTIRFSCGSCRSSLQAPDHFADRKALCPSCGFACLVKAPEEIITAEIVKKHRPANKAWDIELLKKLHKPVEVDQFLEPPISSPRAGNRNSTAPAQRDDGTETAAPTPERLGFGQWAMRMFGALLDPRSIQWLLTLGGGLMVLGLLIWLISTGIFKQPLPMAIAFGIASIGILVAGWFVALATRFSIAGRALTFLGCVVLPLNLWFDHAQGLVLLEEGLWIGGVVCVVFYIATVWVMRDALFMYAVEVGVTLTAVLFLGSLGLAVSATPLSIMLMGLAFASILSHLVFPPKAEVFDRQRFGLPLFWCGHGQLAASLIILLATQFAGWLEPINNVFDLPEGGVLLTNSRWASGMLWLAGALAYLYSDIVVRRVGVYVYLAAISLVMAEITILGFDVLGVEGSIAILAVTACATSLLTKVVPPTDAKLARAVAPLALVLSVIPVALAMVLHIRANSLIATELQFDYTTTWSFVIAMLVVAVANRISAYVYQSVSESLSAVYFFFTAGALLVAIAGWLRILEFDWLLQTMLLMLVPVAYLVAARLWRGHSPERPLGWVAHAATAVILAHWLVGMFQLAVNSEIVDWTHLSSAILLVEVAVFYSLAAVFRRKSENVFFAVAAGCGAAGQLMLYFDLPQPLFTIIFAASGLAIIIAARSMGLTETQVYDADGAQRTVNDDRGMALLQAGHGVLSIAIIVGIVGGLSTLTAVGMEDRALQSSDWISQVLIAALSGVAAIVAPNGPWRRVYWVATIIMAGLAFLTIGVAIDLSLSRKLEIFLVVVGLIVLAVSYIGRFQDTNSKSQNETVTLGLWTGSLLATAPLLFAVFYHWASASAFSFYDEIALISICIFLLATGVVWQVKASTLLGGGTLAIYLIVLIVSLIYQPQVAIGIYLAGGGGMLFLIGLLLAVYRDRLVTLPERIAEQKGVFRVIGWR